MKISEVLNFPILPGDVIYAKVTFTPAVSKNPKKPANGGTYTLTLTNKRTKQTFTKTSTTVKADRSSAEWVSEAPWNGGILPLANFGICNYGYQNTFISNTCYYKMNGVTGSIGGTADTNAINKIDMISESSTSDNSITKASTGTISDDGTSFGITYVSAI
jgi:Peptidase A4 family